MSQQTANHHAQILLVEDNPGDARLVKEVVGESLGHAQVIVMPDGEAAMAYLRRTVTCWDLQPVELILLDLNLPKMDGRDVLAEIKSDPDLKYTPVIVLTSSDSAQDIRKIYELHGNCYVTKPGDLNQYMTAVRAILDFWLTVPKLPGA